MPKTLLHIAIDGPVGSGKSFIASQLASRLGITYIYTGAMYRALAFYCHRKGIGYKDEKKVVPQLQNVLITLQPARVGSNRPCSVFLNGEEVTEHLFSPEIDQGTSDISTIAAVRMYMVERQQAMAREQSVVMEGRDIGLRVLPQAKLKIYLTASVEERARRRFEEYQKKGINKTFAEVIEDTKMRDYQDTTRATDPLQKLPDAWDLDTTHLSAPEVITAIEKELVKRKLL